MSVAVYSLLSLLFVQVLHGAVIKDNFEDGADKLSEMQPVINEVNASLKQLNKPPAVSPAGTPVLQKSPVSCLTVIKEAGIAGVSGWRLVQKRKQINQKVNEERAVCEQKGNSEESRVCFKQVEDYLLAEQTALTKEIWDIAPSLVSILYSLLRCAIF